MFTCMYPGVQRHGKPHCTISGGDATHAGKHRGIQAARHVLSIGGFAIHDARHRGIHIGRHNGIGAGSAKHDL